MIRTVELAKTYGKHVVFEGFSHRFEGGNVYGISGNNGSGKSTLLKTLAGYLTPTSGTIEYYAQKNERIQADTLFRHLAIDAPYAEPYREGTVQDCVAFHFRFKQRMSEISNEEICQKIRLQPKMMISDLSTGMFQRLKLALAVLSDVDFLFLDEPTENLDRENQQWFYDLLSEYRKHRTVFLASNKPEDFGLCCAVISMGTSKNPTVQSA